MIEQFLASTEVAMSDIDVGPFKSDKERKAFWAEHERRSRFQAERASDALSPWRDYLAEVATDRQVRALERVVALIRESADCRAEKDRLNATIQVSAGCKMRFGRKLFAVVSFGEPGDGHFSTGNASIGVRGATSGSYYSEQLVMSRKF